MLHNAYLLAKIGADTAENERNFAENLLRIGNYPTATTNASVSASSASRRCASRPSGRAAAKGTPPRFWQFAANFTGLVLGCIEAKFCK